MSLAAVTVSDRVPLPVCPPLSTVNLIVRVSADGVSLDVV